MADVQGFLAQLMQGEQPSMLICGEAGLGKSRLIYESKYCAREKNIKILHAHCTFYGARQPGHLLQNILRQHFSLSEWDDEKHIATTIQKELNALLSSTSQAQFHIDSIKYLMGIKSRRKEGNFGIERTFQSLDTIFKVMAKDSLLLVLEDLHWIDEVSVRYLSHLLESMGSSSGRFGLLMASRPTCLSQDLHEAVNQRVDLKPFTRDEMEHYLKSLLITAFVPRELVSILHHKSQGNPFFAEEIIKSLLMKKKVVRDGSRFIINTDLSKLSIPDSVNELIMSRIDSLDMESKRILQMASVIGRRFDRRVLSDVTGQEKVVDQALETLVTNQMIFKVKKDRENDGEEYIFKHYLTRDVAYNSMLHRTRRELHNRIAQAITKLTKGEEERAGMQVAQHYHMAGMPDEACHYYYEEGRRHEEQGNIQEARRQYQECLAAANDDDLSPVMVLTMAECEALYGDVTAAETLLSRINEEELVEPELSLKAAWVKGQILSKMGRSGQAAVVWEAALDLMTNQPESELMMTMLDQLADALCDAGLVKSARHYYRLLQVMARSEEDPFYLSTAALGLARLAFDEGHHDEADHKLQLCFHLSDPLAAKPRLSYAKKPLNCSTVMAIASKRSQCTNGP